MTRHLPPSRFHLGLARFQTPDSFETRSRTCPRSPSRCGPRRDPSRFFPLSMQA